MTPEEVVRQLEPWRAAHQRSAWQPCVDDDIIQGRSLSHFGGLPERGDRPWPRCAECKQEMRFLLQLDLGALPAGFRTPLKSGLLFLFYCSTDDGGCETWRPFSGTHSLQVLARQDGFRQSIAAIEALPERQIIAWKELSDLPSPAEQDALGLAFEYDFKNEKVTITCREPKLEFRDLDSNEDHAELISTAHSGDKLGGWPHWVQGVEYPACPECNAEMALLMQLDSEDNLDYMFGDAGCAHITQCPRHPTRLAFGWACG